MHRIDGPLALPVMPVPAPTGVPGFFFRGNPRTGVLATQVDDDWLNAMQEEVAHVIEWAEITLDKMDHTQLRMAIELMIQRGLPPTPFLPLAGGTMSGPIHQHIWPGLASELTNKAYVDHQDAWYHNEATGYANARAIQEGDRAQNNAWAWDQQIWDRVHWIDGTQGGMQVFGGDGLFTVPGATRVIDVVTTAGGGGAGGTMGDGYAGGGGGAGGTSIIRFAVTPGQQFWVTVGGGGTPGQGNGSDGGSGSASQFGDICGASGGSGGAGAVNPGPSGGLGGTGFGNGLHLAGGDGIDGQARGIMQSAGLGGHGGASYWGGGGRAGRPPTGGFNGRAFGSGGGAGYFDPAAGGWGAPGIVLVQWHR